jgi:hypothetical protein
MKKIIDKVAIPKLIEREQYILKENVSFHLPLYIFGLYRQVPNQEYISLWVFHLLRKSLFSSTKHINERKYYEGEQETFLNSKFKM